MKCTACRGDEPAPTDAEIAGLRPQVPEWRVTEHDGIKRLERAFGFDDFAQALSFTSRVGERAEEEGRIDVLAILATLFGAAVSLGLGTLQIDARLGKVFGLPSRVGMQPGMTPPTGASHITTRP